MKIEEEEKSENKNCKFKQLGGLLKIEIIKYGNKMINTTWKIIKTK